MSEFIPTGDKYEREDAPFRYAFPRANITTDQVIFGFDGKQLQLLLIRRGIEPYKGCWALPGGFMHVDRTPQGIDETPEECARRELREETGLTNAYMEQFGVFANPKRDPRGRVISIGFYSLVWLQDVQGGDDAADAQWFGLDNLPVLAFDHAQIIDQAVKHLREDLYFRPVGFHLLPETFTIALLQRLYECILNVEFDRPNFTKKIIKSGILEDTGLSDPHAQHRAGKLYRFDKESYLQMKKNGNFHMEFSGCLKSTKI